MPSIRSLRHVAITKRIDANIWDNRQMAKLLSCILLFVLAATVSATDYIGRVVAISDGDTLTVLDAESRQHKVRLQGIDAPEKKQPYGQVSKQYLANLVFQRSVVVETHKLDRYKREIGTVKVGDIDANLEQVKAGLAWHYKQYEREQSSAERECYANAELEAREARRGLWRESNPMPPWEFRHGNKTN